MSYRRKLVFRSNSGAKMVAVTSNWQLLSYFEKWY